MRPGARMPEPICRIKYGLVSQVVLQLEEKLSDLLAKYGQAKISRR